ncbi:hypothetical protein BJV82DRAFT_606014 [Fennellomyces sp. T-0311]|nr:hypothetical protein BJV82DRAFT_606014 [Fennellomyces sp. T-0311]
MALYKTYGYLTTVQSASAVAFSTFAVIHGSQIAVANVGGPDMANRWLLLGRPFYQDEHSEGLLVTGAAAVHVLAGLAKAGIRRYWRRNQQGEVSPPSSGSFLPYHTAAGYILVPIVWIHYRLVRELPIKVFGDSAMLDFGIVAWGAQNWPIFTYAVHGALVGVAAYHIVSGGSAAYRRTFTKRKGKSSSVGWTRGKVTAAATVGVVLLSGLIVIGRHTRKIPLRYEYASIYGMLFSK